ncbi:aflatoxin regulatory protein-domain-containing protein [Amylocarpus encephaloides]|uniref:Aflatoxin regulatory protein-domain-containing protein n=1 Tax=Amylocarpus encephaloides TaxID=45428 RepID=A0A9P7YBI2_9HELO|nr:aflatoxin regulatory protein-domain-containing protein [Amylocarpus encephaloides]
MTSTSMHSNVQVSKASFSQGGGESTSTTTTSKLRDSCHACALSKVKCHKQKPTCSRCTKRGIACEYIITKRPGRKRDSTHAKANNDSNGDTREVMIETSSVAQYPWLGMTSSTTADSTVSGGNNFLSPLNLSPTSPRSDIVPGVEQSNSEIFSIPFEHFPSELMGMSNDFDDFFNSPVTFSGLETLDHRFLSQGRSDIAKLLIPDDPDPEPLSEISSAELSNSSKATSPPNHRSLSSSDTSVSGGSDSCFCLIQALDIMKKISSNTISASPELHSGEHATNMSNVGPSVAIGVPSAQAVVLENKQTIEVLTAMLQCSCREDGYLLMVLSMVVFRIVGRYAAAALKRPDEDGGGSERSSVSASAKERKIRPSNYDPDDEGPRRMAAQLVLIELHRVQRLINELSLRLQAHGRGSAGNSNEGISAVRNSRWERQIPTLSDHLTKAAPFSAARFAQLEVDMRKCLSTLSSEIINMLRQI